ncbi:MAG TPA: amino acid racemase [Verrucomicrobiae bacterium]|nr:amino acid racemase [Verrucomicrobiae bacterium]
MPVKRRRRCTHPDGPRAHHLYDGNLLMRTAGMIGGLGPESTIDYYRTIIARYRARNRNSDYPHVVINSLDVDRGIAFLDGGRLGELTDYLAAGVDLLARAGADFAFMAANTPHLVFDDLQRRSPIPLVSIVRATAEHARARGLKKLGLFGTGFTMGASFYPEEFQRSAMTLIRPSETERQMIHRKYIEELLKNQFLPETRAEILNIARRMKDEDGIEALVLAGTELPLLLRDSPPRGLEILDTTLIHVEAIVDELLT